ncbi:hypothetical protein A9F13_48g00066, partial [Clavispora lusitaniae]
ARLELDIFDLGEGEARSVRNCPETEYTPEGRVPGGGVAEGWPSEIFG